MIFVITGSTGFIGRTLVEFVLNNGHIVYAVGRSLKKASAVLTSHSNLYLIESDLSDFGVIDRKIKAADVFVNLAWDGVTVAGRDMSDIQKMNILYAKEAMVAAKRMGCKLFVESGSQAEYGLVDNIITEETECNPFSEYGKAKYELSKECRSLSISLGIKYLHCRIFSVFGKDDHDHTLIKTCIQKFQNNEPVELTSCAQNWNFLYVKDAVKQIYLLCEYALNQEEFTSEIFNIASDDTRCLKLYIEELKNILRSESVMNYGAVVPLRVVTLNPNIDKLKSTIHFVSDYCFKDAITEMIIQ